MIPEYYPYLVHFDQKNQELIVHFEKGKLVFMLPRFKIIMQANGIKIPPSERKNYEDRTVVWLENGSDSLFEKAFRNIYFELHMPKDEYKWVKEFNLPASFNSQDPL